MSHDSHLIESEIESETVFAGALLEVRKDRVRLPDGKESLREYIVHPGAVVILAYLDNGNLLFERQFRYPLRRVFLELPAGKIDPGEAAWVCAQRELLEETGYRAGEWACAGVIHNAAAYSTEAIELWFARGLQAGVQRLDAGEFIELCLLSEAELDDCAARGELSDVKTLVGLLWLQKWRAGLWALDWRATDPAPVEIMAR